MKLIKKLLGKPYKQANDEDYIKLLTLLTQDFPEQSELINLYQKKLIYWRSSSMADNVDLRYPQLLDSLDEFELICKFDYGDKFADINFQLEIIAKLKGYTLSEIEELKREETLLFKDKESGFKWEYYLGSISENIAEVDKLSLIELDKTNKFSENHTIATIVQLNTSNEINKLVWKKYQLASYIGGIH